MNIFSLKEDPKIRNLFIWSILVLVFMGVLLRFFNITSSDFVFYDEGFYLNHNRLFGEMLQRYYPQDLETFFKAVGAYAKLSLSSGKSLWFMLADMRMFFGKMTEWYIPRVLSAIFGILTLPLVFLIARKYYNSRAVAWISVGLLAILPSHVFYSRLGLQESLSTFLVLAGFYFYLSSRKLNWQTLFSGIVFGAAFFANYRLIVLPALVAFAEVCVGFSSKDRPSIRRYMWFLLMFFSTVFLVGNINNGQNTVITFSWMFHQAQMAGDSFHFINFLSYPYYLFRLENVLFGLFFFSSFIFVFKGPRNRLLPFLLVLLQMFLFSFPEEKGARYLCVMTPFMAISVAYAIRILYDLFPGKVGHSVLTVIVVAMGLAMLGKSSALAQSSSDYRIATEFVSNRGEDVKFLSTQDYVQNLYVKNRKNVKACPHSAQALINLYAEGSRYLVLDPQAYISWTKDDERFNLELEGYLAFINRRVIPIKTYPHFNRVLLERFVFEHSSNLPRSIKFLNAAEKNNLGALKVYDLSEVLQYVIGALMQARTLK